MKIVQINSTCEQGSTGKICALISNLLNETGIENYILYSHGVSKRDNSYKFGNNIYYKLQALKGRIFGNSGFNSHISTWHLLFKLKQINPDIVHLHNLHSNDINLKILFDYLKKNKIKTIWTFHDCWAFTAYCPHFTMVRCDKWIDGCFNCPQRKEYSFFFDRSEKLYEKKKKLIENLDLTITTPSQWLANLVEQSFFKKCPVKVINNGIDIDVFKPTPSDFRKKHGIPNDKYIVLGVAFGWGVRKGLDVFVELSKHLDGKKYQIVLVGTDDKTDKQLPDNIISIHRTQNQSELAEIYTEADVFVNPTREDNYPTVNMEAIACGTPGVTFNTGGSPECYGETCGSVVPCDDIDELEKEIKLICETKVYSKEACIMKAKEFDMNDRFQEYVDLYNDMM